METGSSSDSRDKQNTLKGSYMTKLGSMLPKIDPFVPRTEHNPRELRSWAKKTGFVSNFSGETTNSVSEKLDSAGLDVERGHEHSRGGGSSPKIEIDPVLGRTKPNRGSEIEPDAEAGHGVRRNGNAGVLGFREGIVRGENERRRAGDEAVLEESVHERLNGSGNGNGVPFPVANSVEPKKEEERDERNVQIDVYPGGEETADGGWHRQPELRFGLRDNPGWG